MRTHVFDVKRGTKFTSVVRHQKNLCKRMTLTSPPEGTNERVPCETFSPISNSLRKKELNCTPLFSRYDKLQLVRCPIHQTQRFEQTKACEASLQSSPWRQAVVVNAHRTRSRDAHCAGLNCQLARFENLSCATVPALIMPDLMG